VAPLSSTCTLGLPGGRIDVAGAGAGLTASPGGTCTLGLSGGRIDVAGAGAGARGGADVRALVAPARWACQRGGLTWPGPVQARAAVLTSVQCAVYDGTKRWWMRASGMADGPATHLCASMLTGLATTTATTPVDVVKTNMFAGAGGVTALCTILASLTTCCAGAGGVAAYVPYLHLWHSVVRQLGARLQVTGAPATLRLLTLWCGQAGLFVT
jgi:hypothetical protein